MKTNKMIGAVKRANPGGFLLTRRKSSQTGYENCKLVKKAADIAIQRLSQKGGLPYP